MCKKCGSFSSITLSLLLFFTSLSEAFAQKFDEHTDAVNGAIYKELISRNEIAFNRITSKGDILYCSLSFAFAMRDYGARTGGVLIGDGSINLNIIRGKSIGYYLKLVVRGIEPTDLSIKPIVVRYLDLKINGKGMKEFKILEEEGEFKSKLVVLQDNDLTITELLSNNPLSKGSIVFTLDGENLDKEVYFSNITSADKIQREHTKFLDCSLEFIKKQLDTP